MVITIYLVKISFIQVIKETKVTNYGFKEKSMVLRIFLKQQLLTMVLKF